MFLRSVLLAWGLAVLALLGACASPKPPPPPPATLFADQLFGPPAAPVDPAAVFALSPAMRSYIASEIQPIARRRGSAQALVDALYARGQLRLDYDNARTRNATEAFDARSGNCLSLLIMTAAFAQELGLQVRFQTVLNEEAWDRTDDLHIFIGHANIKLGGWGLHNAWGGAGQDWVTIDFLPGQDLSRQRVREIDQSRVLAMYMNNRAAEALSKGQVDDAYAWLREGLRQDSQFFSAYNTLGVVYLRKGAPREAEQVLRHVLALEPDNPHVMGNLVIALMRQQRLAEAEVLRAQLQRLQPTPPFALFQEGQKAMRDGDYTRARRLFQREIARQPDYHEFHFWLALAHYQLGDLRHAREELELALESSTTREQQGLYSSKLQRLKAAKL